ncbi:MAG: stage II sporulation protein M [Eubacterium sp.]|jgi:uncharacterized membrane protein SpoIIM required for sporulation|nr:stage II sporulation protein M [Eubacterium sp.]
MKKNTALFFLVFLSGVICANILGVVSGRELGAMNEYFINRYMYANIQGKELFPFLFYKRIPEFLMLLVLSIGIYGTFIIDAYICYLGFSVGFLSVIAIMNYGVKGILLIFGFFLPQWIFYAPMLVLWRYELRNFKRARKEYVPTEQKRRRRIKFAITMLLAGIMILIGLFMESYWNPLFLQNMIRVVG